MPNINGTRDALDSLQKIAELAGKRFDRTRVRRRGRADDGGETGRLVLVTVDGLPECDAYGRELAVQYCTTGEDGPIFPRLDS